MRHHRPAAAAVAALLTSAIITATPGATAAPPSDPPAQGSPPAHAGEKKAPPEQAGRKKALPEQAGKKKPMPEQAGKKETPADKPAKGERLPADKPDNGTKPPTDTGADGSPPGNNGTIKISGLGDFDGIPNNTPHPGCTFIVEWYGFDEGDDVVSTVTFTSQAPTEDAKFNVAGPENPVFVGGDPATGAGIETGLDGRESYTLTFVEGEPHPKQGYHVRLVVETPRSNGNDTKSKVFWVEDCVSEAPVLPDENDTLPDDTDTTPDDTDTPPDVLDGGGVLAPQAPGQPGTVVAGAPGQVASGGAFAGGPAPAEVPTSIASGAPGALDGSAARVSSMLMAGLTAVAGLLLLVAIALLRRTRAV